MNLNELAVVWQSKRKMYKIQMVEGEKYLPPLDQTNHWFVAQIVTGEKQVDYLLYNLSIVF